MHCRNRCIRLYSTYNRWDIGDYPLLSSFSYELDLCFGKKDHSAAGPAIGSESQRHWATETRISQLARLTRRAQEHRADLHPVGRISRSQEGLRGAMVSIGMVQLNKAMSSSPRAHLSP